MIALPCLPPGPPLLMIIVGPQKPNINSVLTRTAPQREEAILMTVRIFEYKRIAPRSSCSLSAVSHAPSLLRIAFAFGSASRLRRLWRLQDEWVGVATPALLEYHEQDNKHAACTHVSHMTSCAAHVQLPRSRSHAAHAAGSDRRSGRLVTAV